MAYWALKILLTPLLRLVYRVRVEGRSNVPRSGPVILASNHQSFIDSVFLPLSVRRRVTFVAKAEYFETWKTAWFFRAVGMIPLKRGGGPASERALDAAREVLMAGGVLGIYPEGTRSPDGRLYRGHTGVARLAVQCGATVIPVAQFGTAEVQPIGVMRPRLFRTVRLSLGRPMRFDGVALASSGAPESRPGLVDLSDGAQGGPVAEESPSAGAGATGTGEAGGDTSAPAASPGELRRITDAIMAAIAELSGQEYVGRYAKRDKGALAAPGSEAEPSPPEERRSARVGAGRNVA